MTGEEKSRCCGTTADMTDEEFASFCELKSEDGAIPAGRIEYVTGKVLFRSGAGYLLTSEQYMEKYGFDPAPVWQRIQEYQKRTGKFQDPVQLGRRARKQPPIVRLGKY